MEFLPHLQSTSNWKFSKKKNLLKALKQFIHKALINFEKSENPTGPSLPHRAYLRNLSFLHDICDIIIYIDFFFCLENKLHLKILKSLHIYFSRYSLDYRNFECLEYSCGPLHSLFYNVMLKKKKINKRHTKKELKKYIRGKQQIKRNRGASHNREPMSLWSFYFFFYVHFFVASLLTHVLHTHETRL